MKPIRLSDYHENGPRHKKINWQNKISEPVAALQPSGIREFFDIVAQRKDCISLGVGEPDFVSPARVVHSAVSALRSGYTHYTGNQGLPSLRAQISNYLQNEYELSYDPDNEILIVVGVSQGLDLALRSIINPGDVVSYARPSYVSYEPMITLAGGRPAPISMSFADSFKITAEALAEGCPAESKALLLNYPSNPTGATFGRPTLERIRDFVVERDMLVISDEIYGELSFDEPHIPLATLEGMKERTLLLGGFSKSFAMTGWRIAYICGPAEWLKALLKIHQYSMLCAPTISQIAAETALKDCLGDRDAMRASYKKRRDFMVKGLNKAGLDCHSPGGAFYVFPSIKKTGLSSMQFAKSLLAEKNVAVVPGSAFGPEGEGFIRMSYATSEEELKTALQKITEFVNEHT